MEKVRYRKGMMRESVRRWLGEKGKSKPAKASNYIFHFDDYHRLHPDMKAVFYFRESTNLQGNAGNLDTQEYVSQPQLEQRRVPVMGCYREICSGMIIDEKRERFIDAVEAAKKHNAVIVTTAVNRYLRNEHYTTKNWKILPTEYEFEKLMNLTDGVPLLTLLHPDMPPEDVKGFQSKWGQEHKGNRGGRPRKRQPGYKKRRRLDKLPRVLQLHQRGATLGDIMALTDTPKPTVRYWIFKYQKKGV